MAVSIVDFFKMIDIQNRQGKRFSIPSASFELTSENIHKMPPVEKAGQSVDPRQFLNTPHQLNLLGDVVQRDQLVDVFFILHQGNAFNIKIFLLITTGIFNQVWAGVFFFRFLPGNSAAAGGIENGAKGLQRIKRFPDEIRRRPDDVSGLPVEVENRHVGTQDDHAVFHLFNDHGPCDRQKLQQTVTENTDVKAHQRKEKSKTGVVLDQSGNQPENINEVEDQGKQGAGQYPGGLPFVNPGTTQKFPEYHQSAGQKEQIVVGYRNIKPETM